MTEGLEKEKYQMTVHEAVVLCVIGGAFLLLFIKILFF